MWQVTGAGNPQLLITQYRSHPQSADFVSQMFSDSFVVKDSLVLRDWVNRPISIKFFNHIYQASEISNINMFYIKLSLRTHDVMESVECFDIDRLYMYDEEETSIRAGPTYSKNYFIVFNRRTW